MEHLTGTRIRREATPATVNLRRCKLVVIKGAQRGTEFVIAGDVIRVGKAPDNDLVLADETVSRVHFEIVRDAKGYLVRDMKSTNGTFLDSAEVKEAYLRAGSVIKAGEVELKFTPFEERIEILPSEKEALGDMVGKSPAMREIFGLVEKIAPTDATVLIEGETGTGKDMIARTLHLLSPRADKPFIVVDCGAVAGTLIESELFGHEKGSFTGAVSQRKGFLEAADGGTLFIDEIDDLSLELQPKLLRALEDREFRRVGSSSAGIKFDTRVIAASKKDLWSEVQEGRFREDLYFRLSVFTVALPPLRDRKEDIPLLVDTWAVAPLWEKLPEAEKAKVMGHTWPGNVRELRNFVERRKYMADMPELAMDAFLRDYSGPQKVAGEQLPVNYAGPFKDCKDEVVRGFEREYLTRLISNAQGNIAKAARDAGLDRKHLYSLLHKYQLVKSSDG